MDNLARMFSEQTWAALIVVSFPVLFVLLGEVADRLSPRHERLGHAVRSLRNSVLPLAVAVIAARFIAHAQHATIVYKWLLTAFWIAAVVVTISFINAVLFDEARSHSWRSNVPTFIRNMSRAVLVLMGLAIIAGQVWDADLKSALTALGVGTIVLGLALQGTLGGIVSGIALLMDRPFREGDVIEVGDITGHVREMNWRSVRVQTRFHTLVIIPNSKLADAFITNLSRPRAWHIEVFRFGFSHADPPSAVKAMLLDIARSCNNVLPEPAPQAQVLNYTDLLINYELRLAAPLVSAGEIRDTILTRVWYAARRHRFTMRPEPKALDTNTDEIREALCASLSLDKAALGQLVDIAARKEYAANEIILHEGEIPSVLSFIASGKGAIGIEGKAKRWVEVAQLSRGDVFGTSGLLRGEPSQLTFKALTDLVLLEFPAKDILRIIQKYPRFATELQRVMARRRKTVQDAREHLGPSSADVLFGPDGLFGAHAKNVESSTEKH